MSRVERSALVPFAAARMFGLVNDVASYPRRFSWCEEAQVIEASDTHQLARLAIKVGGMRTAFTTHNTLIAGERIELALAEGPFQRLSGAWSFRALAQAASRVHLVLEFEIAGRMMGSALALGFAAVADRMVDDFCKEARREFGAGSA